MTTITEPEVMKLLDCFSIVAKKDIEKLINVAKQGEEEYLAETLKPNHRKNEDSKNSNSRTHEDTTTRSLIQMIREQVGPPNCDQPSRCTIPLAMTCFSIINYLGGIVRKKGKYEIIDDCFNSFFEFINKEEDHVDKVKFIVAIYRNGIAHEFFMKGDEIDISYESALQDRDELLFLDSKKGSIILNVNYLVKVTMLGLDSIILNGQSGSDLLRRITNNLNSILTDHKNKSYEIRKMKEQLKLKQRE